MKSVLTAALLPIKGPCAPGSASSKAQQSCSVSHAAATSSRQDPLRRSGGSLPSSDPRNKPGGSTGAKGLLARHLSLLDFSQHDRSDQSAMTEELGLSHVWRL